MGISRLKIDGVTTFEGFEPENGEVNLFLGNDKRSSTPINRSTRKEKTLEDLIENTCVEAVAKLKLPVLFKDENGESQGVARGTTLVEMNFDKPMVTLHAGGVVVIPKISFFLGVAISQTRMQFDRGENEVFALALEDVITNSVYGVSQSQGEQYAKIYALSVQKDSIVDDPLVNGSVFTVRTCKLGTFEEFEECECGKLIFKADEVLK